MVLHTKTANKEATKMLKTTRIRTIVVIAAALAVSVTGAASAATVRTGVKSQPVVKTTVATAAARQQIQGGSTGQGPFNEQQCEDLGKKAEGYNKSGYDKLANKGDIDGAQRDGAAAQALVDYGMDNGCFFTTPW
jgi:hypothetical protein